MFNCWPLIFIVYPFSLFSSPPLPYPPAPRIMFMRPTVARGRVGAEGECIDADEGIRKPGACDSNSQYPQTWHTVLNSHRETWQYNCRGARRERETGSIMVPESGQSLSLREYLQIQISDTSEMDIKVFHNKFKLSQILIWPNYPIISLSDRIPVLIFRRFVVKGSRLRGSTWEWL